MTINNLYTLTSLCIISFFIQKILFIFFNKLNYSFKSYVLPTSQFLSIFLNCVLFFNNTISFNFIIMFLLINLLVSMSMVDIFFMEIPDELNSLFLLLGLICISISPFNVVDNFLGFIIAGSIYLAIAVCTNGSIGGGDIKLISCLGLILGLKPSLYIIFYSALFSVFGLIYYIIFKSANSKSFIPYGPFIAMATIFYIFYPNLTLY